MDSSDTSKQPTPAPQSAPSYRNQLGRFPWQRLLFLLLAVALLVWVWRTISLQEALATLSQLGPLDLLFLALINLLVLSTFAGRWWLLLKAQGQRVPYWRLMGYRITAFSISYFTPGAHFGGEPYQVYATSRWHGAPAPVSIAAVTLDKLLEMLINFAVLAAGVLVLLTVRGGLAPWIERQLTIYSLLLLAIPCTLLIALWLGQHPLTKLVQLTGKLLRRPLAQNTWAQALYQSEEQAIWLCRRHPRVVGWAFLITLLTWIGVIGEFWLLTQMLGLSLSPLQAMTSLIAARIAILVPVPAGLGALEASQVIAMESLGVDPSVGVAIAVVIRARDLILALVGMALGGAHLWQKSGLIRRGLFACLLAVAFATWLPTTAQAQGPESANPEIADPDTVVLPPSLFMPSVAGGTMISTTCPITSTNVYETLDTFSSKNPPKYLPVHDPDMNLSVRGYTRTDAHLGLITLGGDTHDDPPQLAFLFRPSRVPVFSAAFQVYDWDWSCCPDGLGQLGEPLTTYEATLMEMVTTPGEPLYPPRRHANTGSNHIITVLYAEETRMTVTYTRDNWPAHGYVVHIEDFCVDPNLLALFRESNDADRSELPALHKDEIIGTASGNGVKIAVRDEGSFMDPRSEKDWWQDKARFLLAAGE